MTIRDFLSAAAVIFFVGLLCVSIVTTMPSCGGVQVVDEEAATTLGKVISRRLGVAATQQYPAVAGLIEPIANAILDATANGDDLITVLKKGITEIPLLDPLTKKDMQDLMDLIEVNNVPEIYQEIAGAFLEGLSIYSSFN